MRDGLDINPINILDQEGIQQNDPSSLAYVFDDLSLSFLGFFIEGCNDKFILKLATNYSFKMKILDASEGVILVLGALDLWINFIVTGSRDKDLREAAYNICYYLEQTKITRIVRFEKGEKYIKCNHL